MTKNKVDNNTKQMTKGLGLIKGIRSETSHQGLKLSIRSRLKVKGQ